MRQVPESDQQDDTIAAADMPEDSLSIESFADFARISRRIQTDGRRAIGQFRGLRLQSAFQPIFSFAHPRPVGYEALARVRDPLGQPVSPAALFSRSKGDDEGLVLLDRTCRAIHMRNFAAADPGGCWLFLNVHPQVILDRPWYSTFFTQMIETSGIAPHRIVIEVVESEIASEAALAEAVSFYRDLGCLVAMDDFGSGFSNINRIWKIRPDIVKLDRDFIAQAPRNPSFRQWLPRLVSLLHEVGCLVVAEGVETEGEAVAAMEADVDLFQGYYFGLPVDTIGAAAIRPPLAVHSSLRNRGNGGEDPARMIRRFVGLVAEAQGSLAGGASIAEAAAALIERPSVQRCFLLDADGGQIGPNLINPRRAEHDDRKFEPLRDPTGANWVQRPYFHRAVANPGEIQVSRPYLSLTGANICLTLSVAFAMGPRIRVFCCDLDWPPEAA